ncbi:MAG: hypothetical protein Cons2KO_06440 [Congregibacter sp.]
MAKRFIIACAIFVVTLSVLVFLGWGGEFQGGKTPIVPALNTFSLVLMLYTPFLFVPLSIGVFVWLVLSIFDKAAAESKSEAES